MYRVKVLTKEGKTTGYFEEKPLCPTLFTQKQAEKEIARIDYRSQDRYIIEEVTR